MSPFFRVRDHDDGEVKTSSSHSPTPTHTHLYPVSDPRPRSSPTEPSQPGSHSSACLRLTTTPGNRQPNHVLGTTDSGKKWSVDCVVWVSWAVEQNGWSLCSHFHFFISLANNMQQLNSAYKSVGQLVSEQEYYTTGGILFFVSHSRGVSGAFNCLSEFTKLTPHL